MRYVLLAIICVLIAPPDPKAQWGVTVYAGGAKKAYHEGNYKAARAAGLSSHHWMRLPFAIRVRYETQIHYQAYRLAMETIKEELPRIRIRC